ncbi:MAG: hypothetical protein HeimC3_14020 [Candidatus Heimdallarchaeota archaeon LC_3]|nr:MAG: hypothetical protein HeimC3_14020 [Candidatus Heimdallarchaeota archaeon LC_3]
MKFSLEDPFTGLDNKNNLKLYDFHVHIFTTWYFKEFIDACRSYNITDIVGITSPKVKTKLEKKNLQENITFCYFLSQLDFVRFKTNKLIKSVTQAKENNFKLLKIFFGPRLWKLSRRKSYYRINDKRLCPVYSKIQDEGLPVLIHVADPDIWYEKRYANVNKYGTKEDRISDFIDLMQEYPDITWISAHLGSLPENLPKLSEMLDNHKNLFVDTGSTKWMIRELGKKVDETSDWIKKYKDRIMWGSDINNLQLSDRKFFWYSRFWSHRLFWETSNRADLAFKDSDNPDGTKINGLNLPHDVLSKIYYENTQNLVN